MEVRHAFELGALAQFAILPTIALQASIMCTFKAPPHEKDCGDGRAPIDVVAVVDSSGSMGDGKLDLVKGSISFMIQQLKPCDRLGVINFGSRVNMPLKPMIMDNRGKEKAEKALKKIKVEGATNLSGGLFKGLTEMAKMKKKSKLNGEDKTKVSSLLLFTDGQANEGVTTVKELLGGVSTFLKQMEEPCSIFCLGYGEDHDPHMLRNVAEVGKGMFYYIKHRDDIPHAFGDCLGGLLSVVAQNITLKCKVAPGVTIEKAWTSYNHKYKKKRTVALIDLGDIYSEEQRDILFTLNVPASDKQEQQNWCVASFKASFFDVLHSSSPELGVDCCIARKIVASPDSPNLQVYSQLNRVMVAEALHRAIDAAGKDKLDFARNLLNKAIRDVSSSPVHDECSKMLIMDIKECAKGLSDRRTFETSGKPLMTSLSASHYTQRSVGAVGSAYLTGTKKLVADAARSSVTDGEYGEKARKALEMYTNEEMRWKIPTGGESKSISGGLGSTLGRSLRASNLRASSRSRSMGLSASRPNPSTPHPATQQRTIWAIQSRCSSSSDDNDEEELVVEDEDEDEDIPEIVLSHNSVGSVSSIEALGAYIDLYGDEMAG